MGYQKMMKLSSLKYIFLLGILSWVVQPFMDFFKVPEENKYVITAGIISLLFSTVVCAVFLIAWVCDELDEYFFEKLFGNHHYGWWWTFSLIPCTVYAFVYSYYAYMIFCIITFIVLERIRTVQNEYYQEYYDIMKANEARAARNKPEEVDLN